MKKHKEVNNEIKKRYDTTEKRLREFETAKEKDDDNVPGTKRRREE